MSDPLEDDSDLALALGRQEIGALEVLYDRYGTLAYTLAYRMVGNRQTAEDIVQESFLNLWRSAKNFDASRSSPRSWIASIVRNRCIDSLRGRAARPVLAWSADTFDAPGSSDVWRDVSQNLLRDDVRNALLRLPAEQRETIELAYFGGLTQTEVAERMDVPLGTVKGRMRIGMQKLRGLLVSVEPDVRS